MLYLEYVSQSQTELKRNHLLFDNDIFFDNDVFFDSDFLFHDDLFFDNDILRFWETESKMY